MEHSWGSQWQVTFSVRLGMVRHYVLTHLITLTVPGPMYLMTKMFVVPDKKDIQKFKKVLTEGLFSTSPKTFLLNQWPEDSDIHQFFISLTELIAQPKMQWPPPRWTPVHPACPPVSWKNIRCLIVLWPRLQNFTYITVFSAVVSFR
jgi:hypothetical protein